jgi:pimeloyl-ACP methyl ester carboxylesterase
MWYEVVARLDPQRVTAHLLDFRGCGRSDRTPHGHTCDGYASDLRAALDAMPGAVSLVAHSMGGKLAQLVAAAGHPRLEQLILRNRIPNIGALPKPLSAMPSGSSGLCVRRWSVRSPTNSSHASSKMRLMPNTSIGLDGTITVGRRISVIG